MSKITVSNVVLDGIDAEVFEKASANLSTLWPEIVKSEADAMRYLLRFAVAICNGEMKTIRFITTPFVSTSDYTTMARLMLDNKIVMDEETRRMIDDGMT